MIKRTILASALLALIASSSHAGQVGSAAPEFHLSDLSGNAVTLDAYRGKVVFLSFWAPWCSPCKEELPELDRLYKKYSNDGLVVIGISLDESVESVSRFLSRKPVTFPVLVDDDGQASDQYRVSSLPVSFIISPDGIVRYKHLGYGEGYQQVYEKEISELLNQRHHKILGGISR